MIFAVAGIAFCSINCRLRLVTMVLVKSLFEIAEVLRRRVQTPQRFAGRILSALDSCPINLVFGRVA